MSLSRDRALYIITGIPGAGKTALIEKAAEAMPDVKVMSFGTLMLEIAMEQGLVEDRDQMRTMPLQKQREIQEMAAAKVAITRGKIILDTHLTIKTPNGYLPGMPFWVLDIVKPKMIISSIFIPS